MSSRNRGDPPEIQGMTSLKIDNISTRTGPNELRRAFDRFGDIGDIHIPRDRYTGDNKGFAFVRFHSRRDAEYAMEKMDGERVDGRLVRVVMARYSRPCDERRRPGDDDGKRRGRSRSRSRSRSRDRHSRRKRSKSASGEKSKRRNRSTSKSSSRSPPAEDKNGRRKSPSRV